MIVTKTQMIELEKSSNKTEQELIELAGFRTAKEIAKRVRLNQEIIVLCGKGKNGQDGLVIAEKLLQWDYRVSVMLSHPEVTDISRFGAHQGVFISLDECCSKLDQSPVLIDCIYGLQFHLPLEDHCVSLFEAINQSDAIVYSVDINSGLEADSANYSSCALHSHITFALGAYKIAHQLRKDHQLFKECVLIDLNLPFIINEFSEMDWRKAQQLLPQKAIDSYKSINGRCLIVSGSNGYAGANALCVRAAQASGIGYLHSVIDKAIYSIVAPLSISSLFHDIEDDWHPLIDQVDSILVGPGCNRLPLFDETMDFLLQEATVPLVLDAHALRYLSEHMEFCTTVKGTLILTPHINEFSSLCKRSIPEIMQQRVEIAQQFAMQYECILVLKGPHTLVVHPDGRLYINQTGNAKLAKAGSGDVLAGLIAGFVAQHMDPFEACMLAVYLHGLAADTTSLSEYTFMPENIIQEINNLLNQYK